MHKANLEEFAICGGEPAFTEPVHVGRPNIPPREMFFDRVTKILDRGWLTNNGRSVHALEDKLAQIVGVKHCICMCNGTVALEIVIRANDLTGEVILPSFTFVATAHALQWQGITPVFCDIDPETHNIDPRRIEALITPRTTAIIGVHLWGRACDVEALTDIAHRHNLKLIFDAAHAFCCSRNGKMIGGFGDAEVFSFHATKFFNTFEGGAVLTNNDELAKKVRLMKNFGFSGYDNVIYIGVNGKMTEISAAMGLTSLECLDHFIAVNRRNYRLYSERLTDVPGIRMVRYDEGDQANYQYIVLEIDESAAHISRDELLSILHSENILARRYFHPGCHRMEPYRSYYPHAGLLLPNTERLAQRVLSLPTGTGVEPAAIETITDIIAFSVTHAHAIRERLSERSISATATAR